MFDNPRAYVGRHRIVRGRNLQQVIPLIYFHMTQNWKAQGFCTCQPSAEGFSSPDVLLLTLNQLKAPRGSQSWGIENVSLNTLIGQSQWKLEAVDLDAPELKPKEMTNAAFVRLRRACENLAVNLEEIRHVYRYHDARTPILRNISESQEMLAILQDAVDIKHIKRFQEQSSLPSAMGSLLAGNDPSAILQRIVTDAEAEPEISLRSKTKAPLAEIAKTLREYDTELKQAMHHVAYHYAERGLSRGL